MKLKHVAVCLSVFAIFAISFSAFAENKAEKKKMSNSDKAKMILEKAGKSMTKMKGFSGKTVQTSPNGTNSYMNITQRNNPDGTVFMRMDMIGKKADKSDSMLFISNNQGYWYIIGNTAIKMAYMTEMQAKVLANNSGQTPKIEIGTKFSIKDGEINDMPCFVVIGKMSNEQLKASADLLIKMLPEDMKKMMKKRRKNFDITSKLPAISKYFIGKNDFFIYSTEQYNKNGKKLSQLTYTDVTLNIEPEEGFFSIPSDKEVKIARTMTEYADFMINASEKRK